MSVPTWNSRLTRPRESKHSLVSRISPSTLLRYSSCRSTISRSTSWGEAPGQRVLTVICGRVTSGVS